MARTPLLRWVADIFKKYRQAERMGVPVERVVEESAAWNAERVSRRKFIGMSALAAAGLAAPNWSCSTARGRGRPSIAIVGGGISGLACALELADKGMRSTIYEASGRIGGRMFSNNKGYWSGGQITEWCGELIDTDHKVIQGLAARFGLVMDDLVAAQPEGSTETFFVEGHYYERADILRDFKPVYDAVKADSVAAGETTTYLQSTPASRQLDLTSLWDWIENRVPGGHSSRLGKLLDIAYEIEYGAETREQSALNLVYLLAGSDQNSQVFGSSDERFNIHGGNQLLPEAIARHLAGKEMPVNTGASLVSIRRRSDGVVQLTFQSGGGVSEVVAEMVVLTLPFAVLRGLDYSRAGFDSRKNTAIEELGRGRNGKLQLQFTRRLWGESGPWGKCNGTSFSDTGYQNTWEPTRAQRGETGILNDYTGGGGSDLKQTKEAFAQISNALVQRDAADFLNQIRPVFPGLPEMWNKKATSSLPHHSPFFKCSYSYWGIGQYQKIAGCEGERQGNIFFAGEHTSIKNQGYMEGAAEEGIRAAKEILKQAGIRS